MDDATDAALHIQRVDFAAGKPETDGIVLDAKFQLSVPGMGVETSLAAITRGFIAALVAVEAL